MSRDPNHVEEAVRETLRATKSDRDLIWATKSSEYTDFARQAAREDLTENIISLDPNENMISLGPNEEVPGLLEIGFNNRLGSMKIISSLNVFDGLGAGKVEVDLYKQPVPEMLRRQRIRKKGHKKMPT